MATETTQADMLCLVLRELGDLDRVIEECNVNFEYKEWDDGKVLNRVHTGKRTITIVTTSK